jgi:hypothetical protein
MKKLYFGLLFLGLTIQSFAQVKKPETLPEVVVRATNYKYLNSVNPEEVADISVREMEEKVANFDLQDASFYQDDYDLYHVTFYIPEGKILAVYDQEGNILRTIERFKDVNLPLDIKKAVGKRFPGWGFTKDLYAVDYFETSGTTRKIYKIKLKKGKKTMRVKIDDQSIFL